MSVQSNSFNGALAPSRSSVVASSGAWTTLFILTAVYAINIADRYVLSTLIEPIKHEFQLSDASVGFLTGWPWRFSMSPLACHWGHWLIAPIASA